MAEARRVDEEAEVREAARLLDHDRYLAALLAPRHARDDLLLIAAFHGEIARVPASVREPTIGAIRLQWWRDLIDGGNADDATGSPVADRLCRAIAGGRVSAGEATSIIDAYEELLHPAALTHPGAVEAFCDAGQGAAFRLAAGVLGCANEHAAAVINAAAQSYGRVQLLRTLPILLSKGHDPFGSGAHVDWAQIASPLLAEARASLAEALRLAPLSSATMLQAILPVALVEPYLRALQGLGSKIAFEQATISPLSRVWRIWFAKRRGRF